MISVNFNYDTPNKTLDVTIHGHAGQAELGQDIICASASILAYTLAQVVATMYKHGDLETDPIVRLDAGDTQIKCICKDNVLAEALHTYFVVQVGYMLLAHNYPQYVVFNRVEA